MFRTLRRIIVLLFVATLADVRFADAQIVAPWTAYLKQQVEEISSQTKEDLATVTKANWEERRARWRDELRDMLGLSPWPEKTNLQSVVSRRFTHRGITVETLHFQSRPGLYVTANLYLPAGNAPDKGWPCVLYVCGHANVTSHGRLLGNKTGYQHHGVWFARHDVACLMIDTIQLGELHGEHHGTYKLGRWDWVSRGYTPAGVEAWNAIRAIDLLETRPEIDGSRIGITGRSGGGAYSWFTAALDERIKVAVPVAGITDLENHVVDGCVEGHCDCMYFVNTHGWDYAKLASLVAPRPLLLANTDSDSIFPLNGVYRIHTQLADLYKRLDASTKYGLLVGPGPHKDIQELQVGAFKWLLQNLTGQEPIVNEAAIKDMEALDLVAFPTETPSDEQLTSVSNWFVSAATKIDNQFDAVQAWKEKGSPWFSRLMDSLPAVDTANTRTVTEGQIDGRSFRVRELMTDSDWNLQWIELDPMDRTKPEARVFHFGGFEGLKTLEASDVSKQIVEGSYSESMRALPNAKHFFLLPRGWNHSQWTADAKKLAQIHRRFYLLGQSLELLQLQDYLQLSKAIAPKRESTPTTPQSELRFVGYGRSGALAAMIAIESVDLASPCQRVDRLELRDFSDDPRFSACLPGILRVIHFRTILSAAQGTLPTEIFHSTGKSRAVGLVDPTTQPQQNTGFRIVEVTSDSAVIWSRSTLWSLANLADMADIEFQKSGKSGVSRNSGAILPMDGTDGLRFASPGVMSEMRVSYRENGLGDWQPLAWKSVDREADYSLLSTLRDLKPNTNYSVRIEARGIGQTSTSSTTNGQFRTLPAADQKHSVRIAIGTCQEFMDRDGPHGFDCYRTMLERNTNYFFMAGDVVYYDKLARSTALANYHWQRTYSLPTLVNFHKQVPTYFLKDDHDTYVDDSWPRQKLEWTDDFTFEDGQKIFQQQTGLPTPSYRTISFGKDLQVWLLEGRDHRSPNHMPDSVSKSILGPEQKEWLTRTLRESKSKYKMILSPTPIVGPDRDNKKDNLSNANFRTEGDSVRELLSGVDGTFVVCGDRHWQYHSIDSKTKLHEYSVGPVSNRHAGGWPKDDFREGIHQFLRVAGGYLEVNLTLQDGGSRLSIIHLDPYGKEQYRHDR